MYIEYVNHQINAWWDDLNRVWGCISVHQHCNHSGPVCLNICLRPLVHSAGIIKSSLWLLQGSDLVLYQAQSSWLMTNSDITPTVFALGLPYFISNKTCETRQLTYPFIACYCTETDASSTLHIDTSCSPSGWSWCQMIISRLTAWVHFFFFSPPRRHIFHGRAAGHDKTAER